ncbi:hypothetical protein B0H19DRAFT_1130612 [Mycena capillaripes]|nr:hypothetical protein B0H19DRAFT_1130612 [Mycena capillaripes]
MCGSPPFCGCMPGLKCSLVTDRCVDHPNPVNTVDRGAVDDVTKAIFDDVVNDVYDDGFKLMDDVVENVVRGGHAL